MDRHAHRRAHSDGSPLVAAASPVISSLDELHASGIAWDQVRGPASPPAPNGMRGGKMLRGKGAADGAVADLARRFEGAMSPERERGRPRPIKTAPAFQLSNVIDRTPTTHPDTGRQIAMPPPRPRGEVRTNEQGVTTVHVGVMPRRPPPDAPTRSVASRVGGFGEDLADPAQGKPGGKGKERESPPEDPAMRLFDVDLRYRGAQAGQGYAPSDGGDVRGTEVDDDPRAGSGTAAFGAGRAGRLAAGPIALPDEVKARPRSRTAPQVSDAEADRQAARASPARAHRQQRTIHPPREEDATPRPRRPTVQRAPSPSSPLPIPRSYRTPRATHTPSPQDSGPTSPAGSHASASAASALSDDRTDGIYTYDYTNASGGGGKGRHETYIDADGRTAPVRRYPSPPQDETAYGIPAGRRVLAVLKQKTSGQIADPRDCARKAKRSQPIVVGGRQVVQPGRAMSYLNIVGRQGGADTGPERTLKGMAAASESAEGKRVARMTGYVSAAASSGESGPSRRSEAKAGSGSRTGPAPDATSPRANPSKKKPYIVDDPYKRDSFSPTKTRSRTPQARKVSSEPMMRKRAPHSARVADDTGSPVRHLKASRSATPLRDRQRGTEEEQADEAEAAWAQYYQQMEEWASAAVAAGYDPAGLAAAEGYPLDLDWRGAMQSGEVQQSHG